MIQIAIRRAALAVTLGCSLLLSGCTPTGGFNTQAAVGVGLGVLQATMLSEQEVRQAAALGSVELDAKANLASKDSAYGRRLTRLTRNLEFFDGQQFNFRVYMDDAVNAFAMADGTVRVHSGLLDAMPDDQVLAVIGHEIGHVQLKHSYQQMREKMLANAAFQAVAAAGGTIGAISQSQIGQLAYSAVNARFSQQDELDADAYAVRFLRRLGKDPYAMKRSIETLQQKYGSKGSFLSSHPSNARRIQHLEAVIRG